jgi:hypothetical protein
VNWAVFFLALIAVATLTMALIQVGAIIYAGRLARRVERLTAQVERDLQPLIGRLTTVAGDAARVSALAAAQAERMDAMLTDLAGQVEQTLVQVRAAVVVPAREGLALVSGLRAAVATLRGVRGRSRPARAEDEDALFIG